MLRNRAEDYSLERATEKRGKKEEEEEKKMMMMEEEEEEEDGEGNNMMKRTPVDSLLFDINHLASISCRVST